MNRPRIISLFSGAGGLDLGFEMAGFDLLFACDVEESAVSTYNKNLKPVARIMDLTVAKGSDLPDCDVIIGGPPCQAFSLTGKRDSNDPRAKLIFNYLDIISEKKPILFLIENVVGILSAKTPSGSKVIDELERTIKSMGYRFIYKVLNAYDYGVPQIRKRVIMIGYRGCADFSFPVPINGSGISAYEAIGDLPSPFGNRNERLDYPCKPSNAFQEYCRKGCKAVSEQTEQKLSQLDQIIVKTVKPGGNYMDLPADINSARIKRLQRDGGHTTCYGRLLPNQPSHTINTYFNRPNVGCNIHYSEDRLITIREAMRFQSFPDWFELVTKSKQKKHLLVGNAVPPLLGFALAKSVKKFLEDNGYVMD